MNDISKKIINILKPVDEDNSQYTILPLYHNAKIIFNIHKLKPEFINIEKKILKLNGTWFDIQYLNSLSHFLLSNFNYVEKSAYSNMATDYLILLCKNFYIYFSIIYKIIEKLNTSMDNLGVNNFFTRFNSEFKTKIQIVRNQIIIHKEKPDFRDTWGSGFDTDFGGLHLTLFTNKKDKHSGDGFFELKPFVDAKVMEDYLYEFKNIIEDK